MRMLGVDVDDKDAAYVSVGNEFGPPRPQDLDRFSSDYKRTWFLPSILFYALIVELPGGMQSTLLSFDPHSLQRLPALFSSSDYVFGRHQENRTKMASSTFWVRRLLSLRHKL